MRLRKAGRQDPRPGEGNGCCALAREEKTGEVYSQGRSRTQWAETAQAGPVCGRLSQSGGAKT